MGGKRGKRAGLGDDEPPANWLGLGFGEAAAPDTNWAGRSGERQRPGVGSTPWSWFPNPGLACPHRQDLPQAGAHHQNDSTLPAPCTGCLHAPVGASVL